jgi:hypothetical protein
MNGVTVLWLLTGGLKDTPSRRGWLFGLGVMGFGYRLYPSYAKLHSNIETFDKCSNCPETIGGWGYGGDFGGANANAQHDANENLSSLSAKGCYNT